MTGCINIDIDALSSEHSTINDAGPIGFNGQASISCIIHSPARICPEHADSFKKGASVPQSLCRIDTNV